MLVYCTLRCQTLQAERPCQQCQGFVRLLHECAWTASVRSEDIFVSSGRLISPLMLSPAPVPCGQRHQSRHLTAQLHTTLDTYVSITPGHHTPLPARISGVHALTFAMQSIASFLLPAGQIPHTGFPARRTCHQFVQAFFFCLRQHRFRLGRLRYVPASSRQEPTGSIRPRTIPSLLLPEGVQRQPGVFQQGSIERNTVHIATLVVAEQSVRSSSGEKASAPTKRNLVFPPPPLHFRSPDDEWSVLPVSAPSRLTGGFKHLHLTRGVVSSASA